MAFVPLEPVVIYDTSHKTLFYLFKIDMLNIILCLNVELEAQWLKIGLCNSQAPLQFDNLILKRPNPVINSNVVKIYKCLLDCEIQQYYIDTQPIS
jgi:hypothetical protein